MESVDWGAYSSFHVWQHQLPALTKATEAASHLGSYPVLGAVLAASVLWLVLTRRFRTALFLACLVPGGALLAELLKLVVPRDRPSGWDQWDGTPLSFPSAEAFTAVMTYGAVAIVLARSARGWPGRLALFALAGLLVVLGGGSQLFQGDCFLSDLLAGWAGGLALLLAGCALALPDAEPQQG